MPKLFFTLNPLPPFDLKFTAWALRRRPNNEIDRWEEGSYSRIVVIGGDAARIHISQAGDRTHAKLDATATGAGVDTAMKSQFTALVGRILSQEEDLTPFYEMAQKDRKLAPLTQRFRGMKPPRFPTVFEALVNAFACQQVSLDVGITLLNRLSTAHGVSFREDGGSRYAFPRPEDLAALSPDDFRKLGFSRNKGLAIIELSERVLSGTVDLEGLEEKDDAEAIEALMKIRGVGRWSAEYALLRGLGRTAIMPGDDVGAQKNLQNFLGLRERPDYEAIRKIASRWRPYAGLVYFHFLLDRLSAKGYLS